MKDTVIRELIDAASHALAVFRSLAERGYYPQELLPEESDGTASELFMGKQGLMFLINPIKRAQAILDEETAANSQNVGDWIPWKGGDCPVPAGTLVQYRMRCDDIPDEELQFCDAADLYWQHGDRDKIYYPDAEIIAYRLAAVEDKPPISAWVGTIKTSKGNEYYVCVGRPGDPFDHTYLTPQMYRQKGRAEYDVAEWNAMLNGTERPDIMDFDMDTIG